MSALILSPQTGRGSTGDRRKGDALSEILYYSAHGSCNRVNSITRSITRSITSKTTSCHRNETYASSVQI